MLSVLVLWPGGAIAEAEPAMDCEPWPGEFSPLPTVSDPDPFAAQWAVFRSRELARLADELESEDRVEAHRLWQRILCLDPASETAHAGVERTSPVEVRRAGEPAARDLEELDGAIARAESLLDDARFHEVMEEVRLARTRLDGMPDSPVLRPRRARLETLAATALIAFGDQSAARERFTRALDADPGLVLDERSTSPKVRRVFEAARSSVAAGDS